MIGNFAIFIIFMLLNCNLNPAEQLYKINNIKIDFDNDSIFDKIEIDTESIDEKIVLKIYLSSISLHTPAIINYNAIPHHIYDGILCDEINIDTIGFSISMSSVNGNNFKSKIFYFKSLNDDIVLYQIEEHHLTKNSFIQETCTIYFEFSNLKKYDPFYSIYNFNFNDFW